MQKEINAQNQITQRFNELAPKAAVGYAALQVSELKRQAEIETNPERKAELLAEAAKWSPNGGYNIAMNVIIGAAGGNLESSIAKETLSWAANEMRQAMIEDSKKFKGLCDTQGNCISNQSGKSVGVNGDDFKLAGGRIVLADWCSDNRCTLDSTTKSGYKENSDGTVIFNPGVGADGKSITLSQFIEQHEDWRSPLGGHQGGQGLMDVLGISFNYEKGSFWDRLAEGYAGTHDTLNSYIWYDQLGNGKSLGGTPIGVVGNITNMTNVGVATPFALSVLLPPEVWSVMSNLAKFGR